MIQAPQTPDGKVLAARPSGDGSIAVDLRFSAAPGFREAIRGREQEVVFTARSRLARLGIDVQPASLLTHEGQGLTLAARVRPVVRAYGVESFLHAFVKPGLRLGRLVFCPAEHRLTSEQIDDLVQRKAIQLPRSYSIDRNGRFRIQPHSCVYDLLQPLTLEILKTIVAREDGRDLLNRLQVRRPVDRIVLEPGEGVITSCSMFLHRHYVVLENDDSALGSHLEALVLDPVTTRGMGVFLEFHNRTEHRIVNPTVSASIYDAAEVVHPTRRWHSPAAISGARPGSGSPEWRALSDLFDRLERPSRVERYSHRLVAVVSDMDAALGGAQPDLVWRAPAPPAQREEGADLASRLREGEINDPRDVPFGTSRLSEIPPGARATLLLGYFPNLVEHMHVCQAALEGRIRRVIFRRASFEHGMFLSSRDHGRLADYEGLGVEVFWCNDVRQHVAGHVFRGLRGFFVEAQNVDRFRSALIFATYGSSRPLPPEQLARMEQLLRNLREFFGPDIAIMTGGGPGAMQQAASIAHRLDMLAGASFIETVDQETNPIADFYQTFQGRSRQSRQRWFEIASFHLFFMGGVGTLEEIGLTLTDMKLGVIEVSPLVFFGRFEGEDYWRALRAQLRVMVSAGRAPEWLRTHLLFTDDAEDVPRFYRELLQLG